MKTKNIALIYYILIMAGLGNLTLALIDRNESASFGWLIVIIEAIVIIGFLKK